MEYDALIIGARAAGASLGLLLAQQGRRALLVDRDHFPSDTMSTHFMSARSVLLLARLGVLEEVEAAGFRRLTRSRTYVDDCVFEGPAGPGGAYHLAPRRDVLDSILARRAVAAGAEFAQRTRAERLVEEDGRVAGAVLRGSEGEREVRARVVVGADGKYSSVAKWVGAEEYEAVPAIRPAYYGHYHGLEPLPEPAVEVFYGHDRIGFIFPMRPDEDCIALEVQPEEFDEIRADPQAVFERHISALPGMDQRMRNARLDGKLIGTKGIENYFRKPYGPGWVLTGDAGYLKDPSTGTGIGDALQQALWLAETLEAWFQGADWDESLGSFQRTRDEAMMPSYQSTLAFTQMRDPDPSQVAWIKAALFSPMFGRTLAYALPAALPELMPPGMRATLRAVATGFGARVEAATAPPGD
ncbi:MAG TPA: NAD(P)/FAD-dependent oxidoreductase [Thermomicrobiaceae bacterium]|nr:NAD(P)/FAD-dependent oxidoreductase [Thermomicrobiaceae bacterium]